MSSNEHIFFGIEDKKVHLMWGKGDHRIQSGLLKKETDRGRDELLLYNLSGILIQLEQLELIKH